MPKVQAPTMEKNAKKNLGERVVKDLTPNQVKVLQCMRDGSIKTASEIAEATGIPKGKRLPDLVEKGYLQELMPAEDKRGKRFKIMAAGRKALDKALKEQDS